MDENPKSPPVYLAPGASSGASSWRLPSEREQLGVDDHVVRPEVTRDEMVRGVRMVASPAKAPHGDQHTRLDYVVTPHVKPDYVASTDLITRWSKGSDFAADTSIRKSGIDPSTGQRFLEEVAFEIVSEQSLSDVTQRAEDMTARGVRRVIAIFVKQNRVSEWSPRLRAFQPLDPEGEIRDETLSRPLSVKAMLDSALASSAVVRALEAKGEPEIEALKARARTEGEAAGKAEATATHILVLLADRGLEVPEEVRARILACRDLPTLDGWFRRALVVGSAQELVG
ncbi:MAG: hypothetical protein HC897_02540 [Thermoanaerobaculia bacterium]|nr:hypothetical protein [Thermoanaerobaculia bacterium]